MAANGMYRMKPVYDNSDVVEDYPTCIYKMKNIHRDSGEDLVIDDPELLELINRQEVVLKELERLTDEVHQIGVDIGVNNQNKPTKITSGKKPATLPEPVPCNIVVKASPDDPPLSVNLLCQFAQEHGLDCSLKSHVHSSWDRQIPNDQIGVDIGVNNQNKPTKITSGKKPATLPEPVPCNIVVKASPDDPPLSVNLLCQFAQQHGLDCSLKSHVHSSWDRQIPNELYELFDTSCNKNSRVCLRFIWKSDILAPNLMVSVATQSPILGEANILRYLARTFLPQLYSGHNPLQITTIDDWLNSAINLTSPKNGKIFVQNLNTHLGKHNWLSGNTVSIADIYCSVALLKHGGQFPKNVSKWMTECRKEFPGFDQVEKLCK